MGNNEVLRVSHLTKIYKGRYAVNDLDFCVHRGEIFGFLGANGAGKSTTMKLITGLAKPSSGEVFIEGQNLSKHFRTSIAKVGAMIETPQFYPYMSGYQNLKFFGKTYKNVTKGKILEIADLVGLKSRIHDRVKTYSLGMKQRLGIAQALLNDPHLLVLDEPTNGLDANGIREIKVFLKKIAKTQGVAIMISSHILAIMESLCDTICIIDKGEITQTKTLEQIKHACSKFGTHYIKTDKPNYAGMLIQEEYEVKVGVTQNKVLLTTTTPELAEIIVYLTQNKVPIYGAGEIDYSLEDAYLDIVGTNSEVD